MRIQAIALSLIHITGENDRRRFDPEELRALAESIDAHGLAVPIVVRLRRKITGVRAIDAVISGKEPYELVAGERRYRAHELLGRCTIDAIVRDIDEIGASAVMLAENTGRVDLRPTEQAGAFRKRLDEGWTLEDLSKSAGVGRETIRKRLNLLKLPADILHWVDIAPPNGIPLWAAELLDGLEQGNAYQAMREFRRVNPTFGAFKRYTDGLKAKQLEGNGLFDDFELVAEQVPVKVNAAILRTLRAGISSLAAEPGSTSPADLEQADRWLRYRGA